MPLESRRIYVDFDDVLCATARGFLVVLQREFGRNVRFDEIVDFELGRSFDLAHEDDVLAGNARVVRCTDWSELRNAVRS